jgi:hypothetical protein
MLQNFCLSAAHFPPSRGLGRSGPRDVRGRQPGSRSLLPRMMGLYVLALPICTIWAGCGGKHEPVRTTAGDGQEISSSAAHSEKSTAKEFDKTPEIRAALATWKELLDAMEHENPKRIRQLTTEDGLKSVVIRTEFLGSVIFEGHHGEIQLGTVDLIALHDWATGMPKHKISSCRLVASDRVEIVLGPPDPEINQTVYFRKTAEGWKFDRLVGWL